MYRMTVKKSYNEIAVKKMTRDKFIIGYTMKMKELVTKKQIAFST